jgi:hypothetical protein
MLVKMGYMKEVLTNSLATEAMPQQPIAKSFQELS